MKKNLLFFFCSFTLVLFSGCSQKGKCIDVTSYDQNWQNDMKCTRSDGSKFYTDYAGAKNFEANKVEGNSNSYNNSSNYDISDSCNIKGNISYNGGEKIYHVPGCDSYNATVINTSYGERWFCTEDEARAAGWRKAYNCP